MLFSSDDGDHDVHSSVSQIRMNLYDGLCEGTPAYRRYFDLDIPLSYQEGTQPKKAFQAEVQNPRGRFDGHGHCVPKWRRYLFLEPPNPLSVSTATAKVTRIYCYRCGLSGHFGDECSKRTSPFRFFDASELHEVLRNE
jgi:hypothetical protein